MKATVFGALRATSLAALCAGALSANGCCPMPRRDEPRKQEPVRAEARPAPKVTVRAEEAPRRVKVAKKHHDGEKHCAPCAGMRHGHDADGFVDGNDAAGCPTVCGPMRTGPSSRCACPEHGHGRVAVHAMAGGGDGCCGDCGDKACGHDGKSCGHGEKSCGGDKCCCAK